MPRGISTRAPNVPRRALVGKLNASAPMVMPSVLTCDFGNLACEVERLEQAGAEALHLDVMDGHFVPNLTFGPTIVETFRKLTDLPLDVHLMIANPAEYVDRYIEAGADLVTIHIEVANDPTAILERIRELGAAAGLAVNPPTPIDKILPFVDLCDMALVMSVMPGFGGQAFDPRALGKLQALRNAHQTPVDRSKTEERERNSLLLQVDGGVNDETIADCAAAGADLLVVGSAIVGHHDYRERVGRLSQLANERLTDSRDPWEKNP